MRQQTTLHVVGLPHTQTVEAVSSCAYTQKVIKFTKMMRGEYRVILYGSEVNEAECDEHVVTMPENLRQLWFGDGQFNTVLTPLDWNPQQPYWQLANTSAIWEIENRRTERDILCVIGGNCQQQIANAFPDMPCAEWGVGYEGIFAPYRAFESYAWMHHVYGLQRIINGPAYDDVIPNFFDRKDFPRLGKGKGDYLLFLGRVMHRKGVEVAARVAERFGMRLVIAGPGVTSHSEGVIEAPDVTVMGDITYVGEVGIAERAQLLEDAAALLAPTYYIEPFGGVAVEAMMCGTPVVASDWGAFVETVEDGVSGYRFRTLAEGAEAVEKALALDRKKIRKYALDNYSLEAIAPLYGRWFDNIENVRWGEGWAA